MESGDEEEKRFVVNKQSNNKRRERAQRHTHHNSFKETFEDEVAISQLNISFVFLFFRRIRLAVLTLLSTTSENRIIQRKRDTSANQDEQ